MERDTLNSNDVMPIDKFNKEKMEAMAKFTKNIEPDYYGAIIIHGRKGS